MRYLILLCCLPLFIACAAELSPDEIDRQSAYSFPARPGEADQFPIATEEDTLPLPKASANDRVSTPPGAPAPTPYGLTIEEEPKTYDGSKGTSETAAAPALAAQKLLTGKWVNAEDGQEMVELTPSHYKTFYEGSLLVQEDMTFYASCPSACSGGKPTNQPCFTISGPAQTDCYGIVRLNEEVLELRMLGVSNETVVYRRADE
ncbi:hypothetical protein GGR28_000728 [Lewinella aquimaris]|uniref:Lipoprotein n=1 Tax=Neolewinella aquimaris TaxID=1835722 RepID=A0A840E4T0_9BACT|nr:hypothetical protein [Neolewinella aquimaris]MBB4078127.1 hypothetical protein [Neolewinella aquimaris]